LTSNRSPLVLITGASGLIGGLVANALPAPFRVRALNRRDVPRYETVRADITDFDAMRPAFDGVHTVVHLSALLIQAPERDLIRVNIEGTYNVFEAARQAGVKRVVFASSGAVMGGYMKEEPFKSLLRWSHPALPSVFYGAAKLAGEDIGRYYHEAHGISVICIRFGAVFPDDRPKSPSQAAVYMSHRDAAQVVVKSVQAPEGVGFETFYALSDNAARFRDIEHARKVTGFVPQDGVLEWPPHAQ